MSTRKSEIFMLIFIITFNICLLLEVMHVKTKQNTLAGF